MQQPLAAALMIIKLKSFWGKSLSLKVGASVWEELRPAALFELSYS